MSFADLRAAQPALWHEAGVDLRSASILHDDTCDEIHANGVKALEDNWADAVGDLAKGELKALAEKFRTLGVLDSGAASAMDTLDDAILVAQREVNDAVYTAQNHELVVSADGRVSLPPDTTGLDPELLEFHRANAQQMIDDAVEAATQADEAGRSALESLKVDPDTTSAGRALELQAGAVHDALSMMRNQLPDGLTPEQQTEWWNNLTPEMQEDFKKAVPLDLYNLPGLPAAVKSEMEATDRGYNAMEALQYARDQWDDTGSDIFPNNCAHFVSQTLHAGGLPYKGGSTMDENGWGRSAAGEWEWNMPDTDYWPEVEGYTHSRSWYNADSQQDFFLNNGGESVGVAGARPGDIMYFDYADGPGGPVDGEAHHAAVVTAVLPDGEVLYTQHTAGAENSTLTGRLPMVEQDEGAQNVTVVRPRLTW